MLDISWKCEDVDLGSDHTIITLTIRGPDFRAKLGAARITDWDKMRAYTQQDGEDADEGDPHDTSYKTWAKKQMKILDKFTQEIATTTKRRKRKRRNRKLARRIAELNNEISEYVAKLSKENWLQVCDGPQGQLPVGKTWKLLRHLTDPAGSKTASNRLLTKVLNTYDGDSDRLMKALEDQYFQTERGQHPIPREYTGPSNEDLDRPFTIPEMWTAIDESNKKSAPGRDAITYRLLANISDAVIYVDTDVVFLHPVEDFWRKFYAMNEWQMAGMAPETEDFKKNYYLIKGLHPFVQPFALNAGLLMMNLTRMRAFGIERRLLELKREFEGRIPFADQDLLNILFTRYPQGIFTFTCRWNFRGEHCQGDALCTDGPVAVVHASRKMISEKLEPAFVTLHQAMQKDRVQEAVFVVEEYLVLAGLGCSPAKSELLMRRPVHKVPRTCVTKSEALSKFGSCHTALSAAETYSLYSGVSGMAVVATRDSPCLSCHFVDSPSNHDLHTHDTCKDDNQQNRTNVRRVAGLTLIMRVPRLAGHEDQPPFATIATFR
ncbi:hypothetical protein HPB49_002341 [Dermacentor silvarum]|uniref:Uncharacterized protein n=1 Tax=Dermacentor silvarum TaxID=543639 RepID=A0ACB8CCU4_DERSI|nr:hypothetical protein HPB49_002341 [Dermacentor silvarum]